MNIVAREALILVFAGIVFATTFLYLLYERLRDDED